MNPRVAVVGACPYPVPQGSQVFLRDNALALQSAGHHVVLVTYGHGLGEDPTGLPMYRAAKLPGATRTNAGPSWGKPLLDLFLLFALRRCIKREAIDAVIAHNYEGLAVALAARKRPVIYHAHNAMTDELPHYFGGAAWARRFGAWLDRTFPRRADAVLAPHQRLADYLIECGCNEARVHVVPPPVDPHPFDSSICGDAMPPVLYAGNLDAYQNLDFLLGVMDLVREHLPEARLLVATHTPREIPGAECVPLHGFDDLKGFLAQDGVFALPRTSWSGYPIKLLNAMAAGKAVVACESAAHPLQHRLTGLVVEDDDIVGFSDALRRLLTDPVLRSGLGRAARIALARDHQPDSVGEMLSMIVHESIDSI